MKKLLFLAMFIFVLSNSGQSAVLESFNLQSNEKTETIYSTQLCVQFQTSASMQDLQLLGAQHLTFTDANGDLKTVLLTVDNCTDLGADLQVSFSTGADLSDCMAEAGQSLEFVNVITGATVSVDFIIVDTIFH